MEVRRQTDKTPLNWAREGYVAKRGHKPVKKWTNCYCQHISEFLSPGDVKQDPVAAVRIVQQEKDRVDVIGGEKARIKRQELQEQKARYRKNSKEWGKYLSKNSKVLVFDTETSGLDCDDNDILSLSWQLVDASKGWEVLQERTCYFDWVSAARTSEEAIEVNGLTRERLSELGTISRSEGITEFAAALEKAHLLVAHNGGFDKNFIISLAQRENCAPAIKAFEKPMYDTMKRMTGYCGLRRYNGRLKWPRLSELAYCLKIDDSDIDYHQSSADVELTKRCFVKIIENGLDNI